MTAAADTALGATLVDGWEAEDTRLENVVTQLSRLRSAAESGATRAAVVNLVVLAAADAGATRAVDSIVGLGRHHPGRITVVVPRPDGPDPDRLGARLELYCSRIEDRYLWWDVVRLEIGGTLAAHAESLVNPLLLHDLPVALWLVGGTSRVGAPALLELANQIIVSGERAASASPSSAANDLVALARSRPVADLAWLATEPARQALARLFDAPARAERLAGARAMEVEGPPWSGRLLGAWFCERTGLDPASVTVGLGPELRATIDLGRDRAVLEAGPVWPAGAPAQPGVEPPGTEPGLARARLGSDRVTVAHGGSGTPRLLAAALSRPWRDRRYEAALAQAGRLAG